MTFAMANGFALERLLEPEAASEESYGTMLAIFFTGLRVLGRGADSASAQKTDSASDGGADSASAGTANPASTG
jgi:hypothetical protein